MPIDNETFESGEDEESIRQAIKHFLHGHPDRAFNVREITAEVMDVGISERNVERPSDFQTFMAEFVDVTTVSSILDTLVDRGIVERRIVDTGEGPRSYYRTCAR